jgi:Flp pilus assembly protein TadG
MTGSQRAQSARRPRLWRWLRHGAERGNAAVELALLLPVLLALVFGAIDFARLFYAHIAVASAAHEAAIYLGQNTDAQDAVLRSVAAAEANRLSGNFLTFSGATANTTLAKITTMASGTANTNMFVRVQLTYTFQPTVPFPLRGPISVRAVADAPKMRALT